MVRQLPEELAWENDQCNWAVARGYLLRGTRAALWGRDEDACEHFRRACVLHAQVDDPYIQSIVAQLLSYEAEFGVEAAECVLRSLTLHLEKLGSRSQMRYLRGCYWINLAFRDYRDGNYSRVPGEVARAFTLDPQYLVNRGALSILFRSICRMSASFDAKLNECPLR
jgi:hypothetical protein